MESRQDMIRDPKKLRDLIKEYGSLCRLRDHTPQTRGQRLNHFVAELLQCWGIDAVANVRGRGEIDVGFELEGRRFVAEAKWETAPIGMEPIAKLQKRLRQRLGGTIGLVISVSGYTEEAIRDLKEGEQLMVLLLSQEHLEAMLSGFISPGELLNGLITRASWLGEGFAPPTSLFETSKVGELGISFSCPGEIPTLIEEAVPGFRAEAVASSLPFGQTGIAEMSLDTVLVTLQQGLFTLDLEKHTANVCLPIPGCSRNALIGSDGSIYVVRKAGVGRIKDGHFSIVAGGFCGNVCLFQGNRNDTWVFANGYFGSLGGSLPVVSRLGEAIGNETVLEVNYPAACGVNAALVEEGRFLIVGSAGIAVVDLEGSADVITRDLVNPMGLMHYSGSHFVVAWGEVELSDLDVSTCSHRKLAHFGLQGSVSEIAKSAGGGGYLFTHYSNSEGRTRGILVRWHY